ncbi:MAG: MinD/ParA family protein [Oleiphilaceae bacterium]|nr:MinD/ParA family protein [Oleiphilaceae bacterium]
MSVLSMHKHSQGKRVPRVLAITGGKGGVGKTSISVNLAIALSRNGNKVCLFDADTGLANVNIMLGMHPPYTLEHLFTGEKSIQDIVVEGPEGIHIVPGASGFAQCVELDVGQQQRLLTSIESIEPHYDYMLVDTAAGISPTVLHFIAAAQLAAVVITPEPTSLTDAFSLLKVLKRRGYRRRVQVIVNMCSSATQAEKVFRRFSAAVDKYLGLKTESLGSVWMDESMRTAVTLQRPVALFPKTDPSARSFYRLADRVDNLFSRTGVPTLPFSAYWQKLLERHAAGRAPVAPASTAKSTGDTLAALKERMQRSQIERQLEAQRGELQSTPEAVSHKSLGPLSADAENEWLDLRIRLNQFVSRSETTPEQVTTLLSSCIYSFGERLGNVAIDLIHGLMASLDPERMSDAEKRVLRADFERIAGSLKPPQKTVREVSAQSETDGEVITVGYDSQGFGCQDGLARQIRQAEQMPLEALLESIKYASLVETTEAKENE